MEPWETFGIFAGKYVALSTEINLHNFKYPWGQLQFYKIFSRK